MTVRVVIGNRLPGVSEEQIHHARLHTNFLSHNAEQLFEPLAKRRIGPHAVEFGKRLKQVDVCVHRLVPLRANCRHRHLPIVKRSWDWLTLSGQRFKVSSMLRVVCVPIGPDKTLLGKLQRLHVASSAISRGQAIDAEAGAIKILLAIESSTEIPRVIQLPKEAAILLVPHLGPQKVGPVLHNGQELLLQIRLAQYHLRRHPSHAALKHRKLAISTSRRPVTGKVRVESAVLAIHRTRKPQTEDIPMERICDLSGQPQVRLAVRLSGC